MPGSDERSPPRSFCAQLPASWTQCRTCRTSSSSLTSSAAAGRLAGSVSQQALISRASLAGHRDSLSPRSGGRRSW
jgi:hypothetical protein